MKSIFNERANAIFIYGYIAMGLFQIWVIADGLTHWARIPGFIASVAAFLLTFIPVVGSGIAFFSAIAAWDWQTWAAGGVFFWYIPAAVLFAILGWMK